jgi:hypothetical protein
MRGWASLDLGAHIPWQRERQRREDPPGSGGIMASTRRRKLKKLRMKKANHGKRPLAGK